ncbi:acetyl-CoA synthetase-like protein [Schizophyllum commune H4-8]|uniref:acetyl-CoA synthetase-like protein n=1 Tax=Schizophyllum commune (strain H4-8 / FGSC 9210) TaxID=578458 RepID=UPI00215F8EA0|nr:acetyl-CoA synthetase-like protein [Schizophyllum commune H4-8]KAI5884853.1 acetyl-CoA synthetase-like protein [Schizophyllum commune H4-8]
MSSSSAFTHVTLEENVSIPAAVDFHLKHNPEFACYVFTEPDGTVRKITYLEFARAAHRAAHALRPSREGEDGAVVAVIALSDTVLYQAVTVGLIKASLVPFPISPRLSSAAVANLMRMANCHRLVATQQTLQTLISGVEKELGAGHALKLDEMPLLDLIYPRLAEEKATDAFEPYPEASMPPKPDDLALYLHSSGSTGFPKAIGHTYTSLTGWSRLGKPAHRNCRACRFAAHMLPAFHTFGVCLHILSPLYGGSEIALYKPVAKTPTDVPPPPTAESQLEAARACRCTAMLVVPAYIHQWAEDPSAVEYLKTLQVLGFGGGPLSEAVGDGLSAAGVRLRSGYGATEFGGPSHIIPTHEEDWKEWSWIEIDTNASLEWEKQSDGTEELIIPAVAGHWHQPAVKNMEDRPGYATNDLFIRHPTKPYLRKVVGRKDDVIVHSTGEKTVPAPIEGVIVTSPMIRAAIMFGRGRDEAGILVEPAPTHQIDVDDDVQVAAFRNAIWPIIEEANRGAPAYSRIFKELILVTRDTKPLPRTEKGTVMRRLALQIYEVIESHTQTGEKGIKPPASWNAPVIAEWLAGHVRDITGRDMDRAIDLFEQGFDSLNATVLRLRLLGALRCDPLAAPAGLEISQNVVYQQPTIDKLAAHVTKLVRGEAATTKAPEASAKDLIVSFAAKYSKGLPGYVDATSLPKYVQKKSVKPLEYPVSVLLTGTTGNLGAEILQMLLKDDRVARIYTLERDGSASVTERQRARFADKGFTIALLDSNKLVSLQGDVSAERLGQSDEVFKEMLRAVSVIIHVAWRLDFNLGVNAFESSIRGTRALVDFARQTQHADSLRFVFTSSVASTMSWDPRTQGPVPETLLNDPSVCVHGGGYGQGKYVAERVLAASGLSFSSMRVGQVSGGQPRGAWATTDWFPILVKTSIALGALPGDEQDVTWLSMDAVAGTLLDAAFSQNALAPSHNVVHPRPIPWSQMIKHVQNSLKTILKRDVPVVPFGEWFVKLEALANQPDVSAQDVPGVKLLEFFRGISAGHGMGAFATNEMEAVSETLRRVEPLAQCDADAWVKYWKESGLL